MSGTKGYAQSTPLVEILWTLVDSASGPAVGKLIARAPSKPVSGRLGHHRKFPIGVPAGTEKISPIRSRIMGSFLSRIGARAEVGPRAPMAVSACVEFNKLNRANECLV